MSLQICSSLAKEFGQAVCAHQTNLRLASAIDVNMRRRMVIGIDGKMQTVGAQHRYHALR
jgi:hypothetical protein